MFSENIFERTSTGLFLRLTLLCAAPYQSKAQVVHMCRRPVNSAQVRSYPAGVHGPNHLRNARTVCKPWDYTRFQPLPEGLL